MGNSNSNSNSNSKDEDEDVISTHTVYWIGWIKHGQVQFLAAGPFVNEELAEEALQKIISAPDYYPRYDRHKIVEQEIDIKTRQEKGKGINI